MYSSRLVALRVSQAETALAEVLPHGLREYSTEDVGEFAHRLSTAFDDKGRQVRSFTTEETLFMRNEQILGKISFQYWAERYATISIAAQDVAPMFPLWESQRLVLDRLADLQWTRYQQRHPDGVVADILKDRQVGISTLAAAMLVHRATTHPNINGLFASDVPESSANLWDMMERMYDNLHWWMKPSFIERVKNEEIVFGIQSRLMLGASKSTRGRDKDKRTADSSKGQLGRGRTLSVVHLSELATWTNPDQIDSALEPGIPKSPLTLWLKESTAQGKGPHNWWYVDWQRAKGGKGRSIAIFIPWYLEKSRHWLPYPAAWSPKRETLEHAQRIAATSPRWCQGKVYQPAKEQLYWYEVAKDEAVAKDQLESFLSEHPADDEEAFQFSGRSVFSSLVRDRVRLQARPLIGMVDVKSNRELGTHP